MTESYAELNYKWPDEKRILSMGMKILMSTSRALRTCLLMLQ